MKNKLKNKALYQKLEKILKEAQTSPLDKDKMKRKEKRKKEKL